ncbi:DUF6933 domain-containing protein [Metabacillus sp. SLBN-84]
MAYRPMLIQCTKKLLDELKVTPAEQAEEINPILSWHANSIKIGRHKFLVLVNDKNSPLCIETI